MFIAAPEKMEATGHQANTQINNVWTSHELAPRSLAGVNE
jgi:hypothetical protein